MKLSDEEYHDLKLRATICPVQAYWPTQFSHWQKLGAAIIEARERASRALKAMDTINADINLSPEGRVNACRKLAEKAVADFKASRALDEARAAVEHMQKRWNAKIDEAIKPATDVHAAMIYGKILDRVASMPREGRLTFFHDHGDDPQVVSALLLAPSFVSGLGETELAVIRSKVATRVLGAEVSEARAAAEKALSDATKGWSRAQRLIEERGKIVPERGLKAVA